MRISFFYAASLLVAVEAFTITSPTDGEVLDPTQPITFSWTSDSSDPTTFNIVLDNSASGGLTNNVVVATDVSTSAGSYTISTNAARTYGEGFTLMAESAAGNILATSPSFSLAMEAGSSSTYTGSIATTNGVAPAASTGAQPTVVGASGSSTAGSTSSMTGSNSFTTSTVSRSGSGTVTSSSSSSPTATTSQNAQPKLGSRTQYAFTAAGLIAGFAALLA